MAKLIIALLLTYSIYGGVLELENFASKFTSNKKLISEVYKASEIAEREANIDRKLIWSIIAVESGFKNISNTSNSVGLCQLQLSTAQYVYEKNKKKLAKYIVYPTSKSSLYHVRTNILLSAYYLKYLKESYNLSTYSALRAYNAGPSGYKKVNNSWYSDRVMKYRNSLH